VAEPFDKQHFQDWILGQTYCNIVRYGGKDKRSEQVKLLFIENLTSFV